MMKKLLLLILFFACLATTGQAQEFPHFKVKSYNTGNTYYPRGESFYKDSLYFFQFRFKDANFIKPLKKMLQRVLDKEIYKKYDIKEDPTLGHMYLVYSEKGELLRTEIVIGKKYLHLFPDQVLWKIYENMKQVKLKPAPAVGGIARRPRYLGIKDENGNIICDKRVKQAEFFILECSINRKVDFFLEFVLKRPSK